MTVLQAILARDSLSLADLTIGTSPTDDFWLPEDGISWPHFGRRKDRAPVSRYVDGPGALLSRVADAGTFPLAVYATGDTDAEVVANMAVLQAAVDQWTYDLTLVTGSASQAFTAECADDEIAWGDIDSGMVRARIARGSVVIPLVGAS